MKTGIGLGWLRSHAAAVRDAIGVSSGAASVDEDLSTQVTGSTAAFTLGVPPVASSVRMYMMGMRQRRGDEFTVSGSTVTFTFTPPAGTVIEAEYTPA